MSCTPASFTNTSLLKVPIAAALYPTLILVVALGAIGSLAYSGVVQPQLAVALSITIGLSLVLVISK